MQTEETTTLLLNALKGVDLTSPDGRAGIGCLLAEIERVAPGSIMQRAAAIELRRLGIPARS